MRLPPSCRGALSGVSGESKAPVGSEWFFKLRFGGDTRRPACACCDTGLMSFVGLGVSDTGGSVICRWWIENAGPSLGVVRSVSLMWGSRSSRGDDSMCLFFFVRLGFHMGPPQENL
jgi:hypothetical protein